MSPEAAAWVAQIPWVPLGLVAAAVVVFVLRQGAQKQKGRALAEKLAAGAVVIDVRSKAEYAGGHYPGARSIPVDTLAAQAKKLGTGEKPLIVYCASGARSAQAAAILRQAGYTDVTDAGPRSNLGG